MPRVPRSPIFMLFSYNKELYLHTNDTRFFASRLPLSPCRSHTMRFSVLSWTVSYPEMRPPFQELIARNSLCSIEKIERSVEGRAKHIPAISLDKPAPGRVYTHLS